MVKFLNIAVLSIATGAMAQLEEGDEGSNASFGSSATWEPEELTSFRQEPEEDNTLMGSNPCTWGPSYWCASESNAAECGYAFADCAAAEMESFGSSAATVEVEISDEWSVTDCMTGPAFYCGSASQAAYCNYDFAKCSVLYDTTFEPIPQATGYFGTNVRYYSAPSAVTVAPATTRYVSATDRDAYRVSGTDGHMYGTHIDGYHVGGVHTPATTYSTATTLPAATTRYTTGASTLGAYTTGGYSTSYDRDAYVVTSTDSHMGGAHIDGYHMAGTHDDGHNHGR